MTTRITGGHLRGRRLRTRKTAGLRPTPERVRSAIFSILGRETVEGARVLDLFAGTGAMGIEAVSRGASRADFVESDAARSRQLRESMNELGVADVTRVYRRDALKALDIVEGGYDLVFIDSPYQSDPWEGLMSRLGDGPILNEGASVVAEHHRGRELSRQYGRLALVESRRYGDTSVSIYAAEARNG
jgi:16S rRNA (guanine(966)-N(2))-methyltransferase RsmD